MHIETLKVFCDVVETHSFSAAASQNYVTQSAVSQQVRMLEDRYGRRLLERTRGNVQLTPAGQCFYEASREIVARFTSMEQQIQALSNAVAGTLRVATVHSIGLYGLSSPLRQYLKQYPDVQLHLSYSVANKIYEDVVQGAIDIGLVAYPAKRPGIVVIPFREDRLVLVCPPNHALAKLRIVDLRRLQGQAFVGYDKEIPSRKETDKLLRRHDIEPRYVMELDNIETIKRVVEIGRGIAILPEPAVRQEVRGRTLVAVPFADEGFVRALGMIHRQGKHFSPAAEKFVEFVRAG